MKERVFCCNFKYFGVKIVRFFFTTKPICDIIKAIYFGGNKWI